MPLTIRDAQPKDESAWRGLWAQYLEFYGVTLTPEITGTTWSRLMDPTSPMKMRLAEADGEVLGFAIHLNHPSTWVAGNDCYLEDLFLAPAARGKGIGRALIDDLITLAQGKGWHRLYWHTDEANSRARKLYDTYVQTDGHVRYRLRV